MIDELNWLCKHIEKVRSSQPGILVLNWVKQYFPVSSVKYFDNRYFWNTLVLKHFGVATLVYTNY